MEPFLVSAGKVRAALCFRMEEVEAGRVDAATRQRVGIRCGAAQECAVGRHAHYRMPGIGPMRAALKGVDDPGVLGVRLAAAQTADSGLMAGATDTMDPCRSDEVGFRTVARRPTTIGGADAAP